MASEIFIDSDILLDMFLARDPHFLYASGLLNKHQEYKFYTSSIIINNLYYFVSKNKGTVEAKTAVRIILKRLKVLPVDDETIKLALESDFKDFEDALQYYTAQKQNCELFITRNVKDYKNSNIPVQTAEQFLRSIL